MIHKKIAIIGSGTMGSGIAQVAATAGCSVKVYDTQQVALDK
ncbi:MAG: 3-hydroxyacyl-CoA dehydrogenase NAD-binding domain-containing protein, partial [Flavobacterium sp.]